LYYRTRQCCTVPRLYTSTESPFQCSTSAFSFIFLSSFRVFSIMYTK